MEAVIKAASEGPLNTSGKGGDGYAEMVMPLADGQSNLPAGRVCRG